MAFPNNRNNQNQQNNQPKAVGIKNSNLYGGETAIIAGELVFSAITNGTTMFTQSSKFDKNVEHYGVIISNPTFETESAELREFLTRNVYQSKYETHAITLNHAVQTGQVQVYDTVVRREEGIKLERELAKQQVQVYVEIYYSTKFNTAAMAVRAVLIEDENNINYLQSGSYLSAFGLEADLNAPEQNQQTHTNPPVEEFNQQNSGGNFDLNNNQQHVTVDESQLPFSDQGPMQNEAGAGLDLSQGTNVNPNTNINQNAQFNPFKK